ncbi:MAG: hypothetical protein AMXMBFR33_58910 [Candidatus Xenobia bacterium]
MRLILAGVLLILAQLLWPASQPPSGPISIPTVPSGAAISKPQTDLFLPQSGGDSAARFAWVRVGRSPGPLQLTFEDLPCDVRLELFGYQPRRLRLLPDSFPLAPVALEPKIPLLAPALYALRDHPLAGLGGLLLLGGALLAGRDHRRARALRAMRERQRQGDFQPGDLVGPYRLDRPLGQGGSGRVFLAHRAGEEVALKVLWSGGQEALRREVQALRQLHHPRLVRLDDWGEVEGWLYLVMERVSGPTLEDAPPTDRAAALTVARQLAEAVQAVHDVALVHRDVKPGNLILSPTGLKLMDFGLAGPTPEGQRAGTPGYMAPEQIRGEPVDERADLYALGAVLYFCLSQGRRAFAGETPTAVMQAQLEGRWTPLEDELRDLLTGLLAPDPAERRPSSAREVGERLDRA